MTQTALQRRPATRTEAAPPAVRASPGSPLSAQLPPWTGALAANPRTAVQRQLATGLANAPSVARLRTTQAVLQGRGVVQAVFNFDDLLFSSRRNAHDGASKRSLYFGNGTRIRLHHPSGPKISTTAMNRYTFRAKAAGGFYGKSDYRNAPLDAHGNRIINNILKPAAIGDAGKLFEISAGGRTHPSRGRPVAEAGIRDQAHLDNIVATAQAATDELPGLQDAADQAEGERTRTRRAHRTARTERDAARAAWENAPHAEKDALRAQYRLKRSNHRDRRDEHRAAKADHIQKVQAHEARIAHHNQQIHLAYTVPPPVPVVAGAGAGAGAGGGDAVA